MNNLIKPLFAIFLLTTLSATLTAAPQKKPTQPNAAAKSTQKSTVYYCKDITPESLVKVFSALNFKYSGSVAVKVSTGEPPASNYLRPTLIKDLVKKVSGTIVECNTAYGGARSNSVNHRQVAKDHGFLSIADFDLLDEGGEVALPVAGKVLKNDYVGKHIKKYEYALVLSHFKGHAMAGFGGAIKNTSIGFASSSGKLWIHTGAHSKTSWGGGTQEEFCDAMADAAKAVVDYFGGGSRIVFVNVMNRLSIDCDCNGNPAEPDIHDLGVAASMDPVALDKACLDMVEAAPGSDSFRKRVAARGGKRTLISAADIGLGNLEYNLITIE